MNPPNLRAVLPWLIGCSLAATLCCLGLAMYLGLGARNAAVDRATRELAARSGGLSRQIEDDLALFDLALHTASTFTAPGSATPRPPLAELPLTARYAGFINVLNEVGDVVADPRSNVSRLVNFAGRDYFQDHRKNSADILMIGRPFGTAPNQHASIPISRRLSNPDGGFAGVVVAGVYLAWLNDLLSQPSSEPHAVITVRRDDGLILTRFPDDANATEHDAASNAAWWNYRNTGLPPVEDNAGGIRLFHPVGASSLVLELSLSPENISPNEPRWLFWLSALIVVPGLCVLALSFVAHRLRERGIEVEAEAGAANDERMRLLTNISHELRTPLTGVLGQAELLAGEGGLSDGQKTRLARLTEAGTLMRDIVDRVIDMARPDSNFDNPVVTPCDLASLVRTALGVVEAEARRKGVLLTSFIDPATPRRATLQRDRVQQMLINLLMNAVKFTSRGTVALRLTGDTTRLRFEVADTGPGIPAAKRSRLFRAYDRLDAHYARAPGSGLGLSITSRFAGLMGGQIGHTENPGGGSLFWIELPITEPAATVEAETAAPAIPLEIRHSRILLADDIDLTRAVTADFLRAAGHTVTEVLDGEAAIAEVQAHDFDLLLTDMRMPVVDGLEVTRRVRALPGHRGRTPIVLVTADLIALRAGESGRTGVDVCVRKPFTRAELLQAVATAGRLTPVPDEVAGPPLDEAVLADLKRLLGVAAVATYLETAGRRIDKLLSLLKNPDASEDAAVRDVVHDLVGSAGLLGLTPLSQSLRRFHMACEMPAAALQAASLASLREAAAAAAAALRQHQPEAVAATDRR